MRSRLRFYLPAAVILLALSFQFLSAQNNESSVNQKGLTTMDGSPSIHTITVKDMNGNDIKLSDYKGKVLLIVNVASACGYTKQYTGLEKLYREYKDQGLVVMGFPCNDFGGQEPGSNEEIKEFCSSKFDVTFPLFDKISVLGDGKSPLYKILTDNQVTGKGDISWNFEKFLIGKEGEVLARYKSKVAPENEELIKDIQTALKK